MSAIWDTCAPYLLVKRHNRYRCQAGQTTLAGSARHRGFALILGARDVAVIDKQKPWPVLAVCHSPLPPSKPSLDIYRSSAPLVRAFHGHFRHCFRLSGIYDSNRPEGREVQGPGVEFSQRAPASGSGKNSRATGPQQRGGRRLAGSGPAGDNRKARGRNMFHYALRK